MVWLKEPFKETKVSCTSRFSPAPDMGDAEPCFLKSGSRGKPLVKGYALAGFHLHRIWDTSAFFKKWVKGLRPLFF